MANTSSARKRVRQNERHKEHNMALKSRMRTSVKKVIKAIDEKNAGDATELFKKAQPLIESLTSNVINHKNKATNRTRKFIKSIKLIN